MLTIFPPQVSIGIYVFLAIVLAFMLLKIANQYERSVIFRLGKLNRTAGPGLYLMIPFLEWKVTLDIRTVTAAVEQQEAITRDNVPIKVNAVIWYKVIDPARAVVEVVGVENAVVQMAVTTLRTVLGQHTLDEILKSQDTITSLMKNAVDQVTHPWGVAVELIQMKNVEIPESMQRAMAQEAEALREKRARIIKADAELEAAERLRQAAETIMLNPAALELRRMQMITEVGAEQNTTTIVMMPSEFVIAARGLSDMAAKMGKS